MRFIFVCIVRAKSGRSLDDGHSFWCSPAEAAPSPKIILCQDLLVGVWKEIGRSKLESQPNGAVSARKGVCLI